MKQKSSVEIRNQFLEFFESKGHAVEPSASLVPVDDNTLLWINSGVAALKKYFDGRVKPKNPRITNVQKALRTNDIDNVGKTARHHTFFEMLGNFSIGDYFKEEAIAFAYEFLFSEKWMGLDVQRAYISVHTDDDEAFRYWTENHGIDPSRILKTSHNFWQIGDGPCGPNSEIFYDRGGKYDPDGIGERLFFEDLENDRYIEVWNIVFSQFDGVEGGDPKTFKELPQKNIDTGMGFERLVSILQEGDKNFDTDLFIPIIKKIETFTAHRYEDDVMAYRVISDHIRALVFALSDGAVFANEGRGYVLRRILRRAVRFGRLLEIQDNFLYELVDTVVEIMGDFYTNLADRRDMVKTLIKNEEARFSKTLSEGEALLVETLSTAATTVLDGSIAFKLYDTYGFPIELTQEIASEKGYEVDLDGFNEQLQQQKIRARSSRQKTESMTSQQEDLLNFKETSVFRYDTLKTTSKIIGLFVDGKSVSSLSGSGFAVFDQTPFYAESGGQVGDTGVIVNDEVQARVSDVTKSNGGQHLHHVDVEGTIHLDDVFELEVDRLRRVAIRKNHSSVHLLQSALQQVLGAHVSQAGSYVSDEYLRFDFYHFERVGRDDLKTLENKVNEWIAASLPIITEELPLEEAKKTGAMALFSENYGDFVRVVSMGDVSKELCGGTHAINTGEIGVFHIQSEESVGSGVRRIVAKTSYQAYRSLKHYETSTEAIRDFLKLPVQKTILSKLEDMETAHQQLIQEYKKLQHQAIASRVDMYREQALLSQGDLKFIWIEETNQDGESIKTLVEKLRDVIDIVFFVNVKDESLQFIVGCSENALGQGYQAGALAKEAAIATGGNGGGRPQFAQSGGKNVQELAQAKQVIFTKVGIEL